MYVNHPDYVEIDYNELATLKQLALTGSLAGEIPTSCSALASKLDISAQTVSRRLQRLEEAELLTRETNPDGQVIYLTPAGREVLLEEYGDYKQIFDGETSLKLRGAVTSGLGEGKHYISLPGYKDQFETLLGYEPYPGTLNVELNDESKRRKRQLSLCQSTTVEGWEEDGRTFGPVTCYPVTLRTDCGTYEPAHALDIERTHHDEHVIEVIAPVRLRDTLELEDGDSVVLRLDVKTP